MRQIQQMRYAVYLRVWAGARASHTHPMAPVLSENIILSVCLFTLMNGLLSEYDTQRRATTATQNPRANSLFRFRFMRYTVRNEYGQVDGIIVHAGMANFCSWSA